MKIKRLAALLLVVAMAVMTLAACDGDSKPTETQNGIESGTAGSTESENSSESETQKPTDTTPEETEPVESETQAPTDTIPEETEPVESETQGSEKEEIQDLESEIEQTLHDLAMGQASEAHDDVG